MNFIRGLLENKVEQVSIILDNPNQSFFPGQSITGRIVISLNNSIDYDRLELIFKGRAQASYERSVSHRVGDKTEHRKERVWDKLILFRYLFKFSYGYGSKIGAGRHELPFQFTIPTNMPSSFKLHNFAEIEYKIKATVGGKVQKIFPDICGLPAVSPDQLYLPLHCVNSKKVGLFNGKQLNLDCGLPRKGWTLGRTISVNCMIENHSNKQMKLNASLVRFVHITVRSHRESRKEKILNTTDQMIEANYIGHRSIDFKLPDRLPIVYNTCRLIQIEYFIQVKLDIPFAFDLYCDLPIILTYQPLNDNGPQQPSILPQMPSLPEQNLGPMPMPQPPPYPDDSQLYPSLNEMGGPVPSAPPPPGFQEDMPPPPYSQSILNSNQGSIAPYPDLPFKS